MALLETTSVAKIFGGIKAVQDFTIHIDAGELIGLIGPNGAGKTTAFNLLTGVYRRSFRTGKCQNRLQFARALYTFGKRIARRPLRS